MIPARQTSRSGFSLIEVLVAMAILTVIVMVVAGIFQQTSLAWSLGLRRSNAQSAVRAVVGAISRDLASIVDPANFAIGPGASDQSIRQEALDSQNGNIPITGLALDGSTLDFWMLTPPDMMDEDDKTSRELVHVVYTGGSGSVTRKVEAFGTDGASGYGASNDGGSESTFDLGDGSISFERIAPQDAAAFTSAYDAAGVRVTVRPATPASVYDYEIYVGSAGPDGEWGTDDDIRPWVEGETN